MKLFLLGRRHSVNHWLEDAAAAFAAAGHTVAVGHVRRPPIPAGIERALARPIGEALAQRIRRIAPDLILCIGGFHAPAAVLAPIAALPGRPPLAGWVGDRFDDDARGVADLYDAVGFTDTALLERHRSLGFRAASLFLPHAADPTGARPASEDRRRRMVFIANPTPHRRAVVAAVRQPLTLYGPAWTAEDGASHEVHAGRLAASALPPLYAGHLAALNIRNEINVLSGLNQRNFDPCLAGAALLTDDQPDLTLCFEPGVEVAVWRDTEELNDLYDRVLSNPSWAHALGERGRRRVLADHTFAARLDALKRLI
ncbi:MAG: glycosyltransferase [Caulobacteraceae bacterium]|nr:glycosyltransferase [Caulobacteraceae bacterium]